MKPVYLVIGVPGSGKTWVCERLSSYFHVVPHDEHINGQYVRAIADAAGEVARPVLAEAPFSISQTVEPLEARGIRVIPVFIIEDVDTLSERYREREGKEIPQGHLTRQETYRQRAEQWDAFSGTSEEVLDFLKRVAR
jgi:hypothetical protein